MTFNWVEILLNFTVHIRECVSWIDSSIKSESFGVIAIWDRPEVYATRDEGFLAGFVLLVEMKRYPLFYIYNIFIPVRCIVMKNIGDALVYQQSLNFLSFIILVFK